MIQFGCCGHSNSEVSRIYEARPSTPTVRTARINIIDGEAITTTEDHPFYNATHGKFQWAAEIDPGDKVLTDDGRLVTVLGIDTTTAHNALAYNLTVQGIHTYHVGQHHILVHNVEFADSCPLAAVVQDTAKARRQSKAASRRGVLPWPRDHLGGNAGVNSAELTAGMSAVDEATR